MQEHLNSAAEHMRQEQVVSITQDKKNVVSSSLITEKKQETAESFGTIEKTWALIETSELALNYFSQPIEKFNRNSARITFTKDQIEALALKIQTSTMNNGANFETEIGVGRSDHNQLKWIEKNERKEGFLGMRKAAGLLDRNIGSIRLLKFLRDNKYLNQFNQPNPQFIQNGFFEVVIKITYNKKGKPRMYHNVPLISFSCIVAIWDEIREAFTEDGMYKADHPEINFGEIPFDTSGLEPLWKAIEEHKARKNSLKSTTHEQK